MGGPEKYISPEYALQNRQLHEAERARGKPWGMSGWRYVEHVVNFAGRLFAQDILDYGCGSHSLKKGVAAILPIPIYEYDPALPGFDVLPVDRADLVTCTDVLEHVETDKVPAVLAHLCQLAESGVFMVIALFEEKNRRLPDGRSPHLTMWPAEKWIKEISKLDYECRFEVHKERLFVWLTK